MHEWTRARRGHIYIVLYVGALTGPYYSLGLVGCRELRGGFGSGMSWARHRKSENEEQTEDEPKNHGRG